MIAAVIKQEQRTVCWRQHRQRPQHFNDINDINDRSLWFYSNRVFVTVR